MQSLYTWNIWGPLALYDWNTKLCISDGFSAWVVTKCSFPPHKNVCVHRKDKAAMGVDLIVPVAAHQGYQVKATLSSLTISYFLSFPSNNSPRCSRIELKASSWDSHTHTCVRTRISVVIYNMNVIVILSLAALCLAQCLSCFLPPSVSVKVNLLGYVRFLLVLL